MTDGGPFRWWNTAGWRSPVISDLLYRQEEWVTVFLRAVDAHLARADPSVVFQPRGDVLVVTGRAGEETLRVAGARYRDTLLFHPHLHPEVDEVVSQAVVVAAKESAARNDHVGARIGDRGRLGLVEDPSLLLHPEVVDGLRRLDLSGLPALGVSCVVEVQGAERPYLLASWRKRDVAVNPECVGPVVDGGLGWTSTGIHPAAGLRSEVEDELPWLGMVEPTWLGTLLPPAAPTLLDGRPTRRCGVNVVYTATIDRPPDEVLRAAAGNFEGDLVLVDTSREAPGGGLRLIEHRGGGFAMVDDLPPVSEVLAAVLAIREDAQVDILTPEPPPTSTTSRTEARTMSTDANAGDDLMPDRAALAAPERAQATEPAQVGAAVALAPGRSVDGAWGVRQEPEELTLEDAWAEDLIRRHGRLDRILRRRELERLGETTTRPTLASLVPVFDAVRELEFVRSAGQVRSADEARLFEAVVYRITRYLFRNNEVWALAAHDEMLPADRDRPLREGEERNPIGTTYTERLDRVISLDEAEDPGRVWREEVAGRLRRLASEEAVQEYAEVARRGRLLCFCAALWALENKRSLEASNVALNDAYRTSLSGDEIALFFRARALLVSPVLSAAQAQLGLQFVTAALATYERNPGMHHTRAIFLLRQSALNESEAASRRCLEEALDSVESALRSDPEFAKFYATRAKVKYRLRDGAGALVDIRAAIELARYSGSRPALRDEVAAWETLLDTWQLTPLGAD